MKRFLLVALCVIMTTVALAQNTRLVRGVVFSSDDIPLSGVTLETVGLNATATSDENGTFEIYTSPYAKKLTASKEGYLPQTLEIDGSYMMYKLKVDVECIKREAARLAAEQEAARLAAEQEAARLAAVEEARRAAERRAAEQEAARIAAEKRAAERAAKEEAARIEAEKRAAAEEAARIAAEKRAAERRAMEKEAARIAAEKKAAKKAAKLLAIEQVVNAKEGTPEKFVWNVKYRAYVDVNTWLLGLPLFGFRYPVDPVGISYTGGVTLDAAKRYFVGAGIGIQYAQYNKNYWSTSGDVEYRENNFTCPMFFVHARARLGSRYNKLQPFASISFGFESDGGSMDYYEYPNGLGSSDVYYNHIYFFMGAYIHPQIGVTYKIKEGLEPYISIGYKYSNMEYIESHSTKLYYERYERDYTSGVTLNLGIPF